MGYDAVGIARSSQYTAMSLDAPAADRAAVGDKWARRELDLATLPLRPAMLRDAAAAIPSGVAVIGAMLDEGPVGAVASSLGMVSVEPALALLSLPKESAQWRRLHELTHVGVSVLAHTQRVVRSCSASSESGVFSALDWKCGPGGSVLVHGASLWMDCSVGSELDAGDRVIALLAVQGLWMDTAAPPLLVSGPGVSGKCAS